MQTITLLPGAGGAIEGVATINPNLQSLDYSTNLIGITDPDIVLKESATTLNQSRSRRGVSGKKKRGSNANNINRQTKVDTAPNADKDDMVNLMDSQDNLNFMHRTG